MWLLRHLKQAGIPPEGVLKMYFSMVFPVLDYISIVYHSILTLKQP